MGCSPTLQAALLQRMIDAGIDAVLVKVAAAGLTPERHLGARLASLPAQVSLRLDTVSLQPS